MTERLNRREFINLNWESTIGFLGNFLAPQMEVERDFFRPPGSISELEFLTTCTRCGKCKEICPEQSIRLFPLSSGAKLVNTPVLDPNDSPCTFCQKCIEVCSDNALNLDAYKKQPFLGYVKVHKNRCLGFQQVMCDYCVRACPVDGALRIDNGVPVISKEHCTGCGICVPSCMADGSALQVVIKEA